MKQGRPALELSRRLVEVALLDDGLVLFVGRASIVLERAEAEAVVSLLSRALARTPKAGDRREGVQRRN
ncbi:MAG TPA: hypothetical protein VHO06_02205 [Polyangia bacterium]|nr:hypothetical protein [Polyangia bacterium]